MDHRHGHRAFTGCGGDSLTDLARTSPAANGSNVTEIGRWIAPEGSNFWGVTVVEIGGQEYVLGSDRNTGLHIFQLDPGYCETFVEDGVCP